MRHSYALLCLCTFGVAYAATLTTLGVAGCLFGNKGVETGDIASPDKSTSTTTDQGMSNSPGGRQTNITLYGVGWAGTGLLVGFVAWDRRRAKKALGRAIMGIEACGPECDGKKYCRGFHDRTEKYLYRRVKAATE